ncbi:MAG TPA: hypothetical protein VHW26_01525 [Solirubrobacteraceae bacterium]|jgi:hypothetical protein|nr:hypothetical protein [Solirubrobacteraceae bacterium]
MAYTNAEARAGMLDEIGQAADQLSLAIACLNQAYELLDESSADRLEADLFRPVQLTYGRLQRTYTAFSERTGGRSREFAPQNAGAPSQGAKALIERAVSSAATAAQLIAALQDSMLPVEVGDPALRAELADVRSRLDVLPSRARELLRVLGR